MTQYSNTFYSYIMNNSSNNILRFRYIFADKIQFLPDKIVSSKALLKHLDISPNSEEFIIFKNTFMEYFIDTFSKIQSV